MLTQFLYCQLGKTSLILMPVVIGANLLWYTPIVLAQSLPDLPPPPPPAPPALPTRPTNPNFPAVGVPPAVSNPAAAATTTRGTSSDTTSQTVTIPNGPFQLPNILEGGLNTIVSDSYRLTNGDIISLWVANVPEYSTQFQLLGDGTVNLPVIGHIPLWGLTLQEAANLIASRYEEQQILVEPVVAVVLSSMNPLRVAVVGEVNRPGSYILAPMNGESPTLTSLLKEAGGITEKTNLDSVSIYRLTPDHNQTITTVSLWELLASGDLSQDIPLKDGDTVVLNQAADIDFPRAQQIATASFSGEIIKVHVMGEVNNPGLVTVPSDTTLNEILILAGGFGPRANQRKLALFRLNPDGSVSSRDVTVDFETPINEETNPLVQHRDILVIGKSTGSSTRDLVTTVRDILRTITLSPIDGALSIFELLF